MSYVKMDALQKLRGEHGPVVCLLQSGRLALFQERAQGSREFAWVAFVRRYRQTDPSLLPDGESLNGHELNIVHVQYIQRAITDLAELEKLRDAAVQEGRLEVVDDAEWLIARQVARELLRHASHDTDTGDRP